MQHSEPLQLSERPDYPHESGHTRTLASFERTQCVEGNAGAVGDLRLGQVLPQAGSPELVAQLDRKSTRLNSSHG